MVKKFVTLRRLVVEFKKCPEYEGLSSEEVVEVIRERVGKFPGRYCKFLFSGTPTSRGFELYIKPEELEKGRI